MLEEANSSGGEPTLVPEAPAPWNAGQLARAELETLAWGLMSNLNQMVNMMLKGPLPLCVGRRVKCSFSALLAPCLLSDKAA